MRVFVLLVISVCLILGCESSDSNDTHSFPDEFVGNEIDVVQFKARVNRNDNVESFDFNVRQAGEFFIDFEEPLDDVVLIIVNDKTKKVIEKIRSNQIINLKKGTYNLITVSNQSQPKNKEITFTIGRY